MRRSLGGRAGSGVRRGARSAGGGRRHITTSGATATIASRCHQRSAASSPGSAPRCHQRPVRGTPSSAGRPARGRIRSSCGSCRRRPPSEGAPARAQQHLLLLGSDGEWRCCCYAAAERDGRGGTCASWPRSRARDSDSTGTSSCCRCCRCRGAIIRSARPVLPQCTLLGWSWRRGSYGTSAGWAASTILGAPERGASGGAEGEGDSAWEGGSGGTKNERRRRGALSPEGPLIDTPTAAEGSP